jgi:hypothetical protein
MSWRIGGSRGNVNEYHDGFEGFLCELWVNIDSELNHKSKVIDDDGSLRVGKGLNDLLVSLSRRVNSSLRAVKSQRSPT